MQVTAKGERFIMGHEGCALRAYRDPVGVWTIGFGNTNYDKTLGFKVEAGKTITFEQAVQLFRRSLQNQYVPPVAARLRGKPPHALDAGVSFHYNTGAIGRASWVTRYLEGASHTAIRSALMAWNKGGGRVLAGLTRRRSEEATLLLTGNYGSLPMPAMIGANGRIVGQIKDGAFSGPDDNGHSNDAEVPGMLRRGMRGEEVIELQTMLKELGMLDGAASGTFDPATEAAVRKFQGHHPQLTNDGIVGPATRAAIIRELDAKRKLTNTSVAGGGVATAVEAQDRLLGGWLPVWGFWAIVGIATAVVLYVAWQYRDEIRAWMNKQTGRFVP